MKTATPPATLLTFPPMIDGELTRFVLDQHGVAYRETPHIVGVSSLLAALRTGGITIPVFSGPAFGTAATVAGARPIIDWCDAHAPDAGRLLPADPALAAQVAADWDRFNTTLAAATAAFAYFHLLPHRDIMIDPLSHGAPGWEVLVTRLGYPVFAWLITRILGLSTEKARDALRDIREVFAETDRRVADGRRWLVGGRLTLSDIALATAAAPLLLPAGYSAPIPPLAAMPAVLQTLIGELRQTPTAAFVAGIYRQRPARRCGGARPCPNAGPP